MIQTQVKEKQIDINDVLIVKAEIIRITGIDESDWCAMMFDKGCEFAEAFCKQFNNPHFSYNQLVKVKNENGQPVNFFWSWWRFKWLLNDKEWLINEAYTEVILVDYYKWKFQMMNNYSLDRELLEDLDKNTI